MKNQLILSLTVLSALAISANSQAMFNPDATKSLIAATQENNILDAWMALRATANPDGDYHPSYGHGYEPMKTAISNNNLEIYWLLRSYGAAIHTPERVAYNAIEKAVFKGHAELCAQLLKDGASVEIAEVALELAKDAKKPKSQIEKVGKVIAAYKEKRSF